MFVILFLRMTEKNNANWTHTHNTKYFVSVKIQLFKPFKSDLRKLFVFHDQKFSILANVLFLCNLTIICLDTSNIVKSNPLYISSKVMNEYFCTGFNAYIFIFIYIYVRNAHYYVMFKWIIVPTLTVYTELMLCE